MVDDDVTRLFFEPGHYTVFENVGSFQLTVMRQVCHVAYVIQLQLFHTFVAYLSHCSAWNVLSAGNFSPLRLASAYHAAEHAVDHGHEISTPFQHEC